MCMCVFICSFLLPKMVIKERNKWRRDRHHLLVSQTNFTDDKFRPNNTGLRWVSWHWPSCEYNMVFGFVFFFLVNVLIFLASDNWRQLTQCSLVSSSSRGFCCFLPRLPARFPQTCAVGELARLPQWQPAAGGHFNLTSFILHSSISSLVFILGGFLFLLALQRS